LVVATGAGAIGNRTIGTTGAGGMLVGTIVGVLIIPGLYYLFGRLDGGRKLLKDESVQPLSERFEHGTEHRDPGAAAGQPHLGSDDE
jgi:hydrophobic/amphiphilic exporter-1 (mainly G- bacteria), HAE1 family